MPDMKGAHTTQRSVPTKMTKKMTDETIVWAQRLQRGNLLKHSKKQQKKRKPIILMNFCTSYGPFWGEKSALLFSFIKALDVKYCGIDSARTQSGVTVYGKTHRCHWTASAGMTMIWTMDSPPSGPHVSGPNVFSTKTQANVAGYNWFSMLLQYHMNLLTTYISPLHHVFKCFWTMGSSSPAEGNVKSWLMKSVCE